MLLAAVFFVPLGVAVVILGVGALVALFFLILSLFLPDDPDEKKRSS